MPPPVYALSVNSFVHSVGADAGFASIVGLAVLVLLYFSHARETAALRDRLDESESRAEELEARLHSLESAPAVSPSVDPGSAAQLSRSVSAPASAAGSRGAIPAGAVAAASPVIAIATIPAAPAGTGAPALAAATRLIPIANGATASNGTTAPAPAGPPVRPSVPAGQPATSSAPAPVRASVPPSVPADQPASSSAPSGIAAPVAPPPASAAASRPARTAAAGAAASRPTRATAAPPPQRLAASTARPRSGMPGQRPPVPIRPGSSTRGAVPISPERDGAGRSRIVRLFAFAGLALAVIAVVALLISLTSGGDTQTVAVHSTPTTNAPATNAPPPPAATPAPKRHVLARSDVTVAVLNGTPQGGVAHTVSTRLTAAGFKQGPVTNASDQSRTATVISYLPGHRADALLVASYLQLGSASVQPVDSSTRLIACPGTARCPAGVVVTVGTDLKNQ